MYRVIVGVALLIVGCQALAASAWSSEVQLGAVYTGITVLRL